MIYGPKFSICNRVAKERSSSADGDIIFREIYFTIM